MLKNFEIRKYSTLIKAFLASRGDAGDTTRSAILTLIIRIFSAALIYISHILFARWLGQSEFGLYVYIWTCIIVVGEIATLGFDYAAQRFIPKYMQDKRYDYLRGLIFGGWIFIILVSSLFGLVGTLIIYIFYSDIPENYRNLLQLACFVLPFFSLVSIFDGIARSYNWFKLALLPPFFFRPLLLIVFFYVGQEFGYSPTAQFALICLLLSAITVAFFQFIFLTIKFLRIIPLGKFSFAIKEWANVTYSIFVVNMSFVLLSYVDVLILEYFVTSSEIGIYFAGSKTLALTSFIFFAVTAASAHRISEISYRENSQEFQDYIRYAARLTFWPSALTTVGMLAIGPILLSFFGEGYIEAYPVMLILAFGMMARASIGPGERILNMSGQQKICAQIYTVILGLCIVLSIIFIPIFGIYGAALALASSIIIETILVYYAIKKYCHVKSFVLF